MAKFYGSIGFVDTVETQPGIWEEKITERFYSGNLEKLSRGLQSSDSVNDNLTVSNIVSVIMDPFAEQNLYAIRYVKFGGANWKISNVEVQYPRLRLTIGGLYNG